VPERLVSARALLAALGIAGLLLPVPVRGAGPQSPPNKPGAKKPLGDPDEIPPKRGSGIAALYQEAVKSLNAEVQAGQQREASSKRPLVIQSFTQATTGPAGRRAALQAEAFRIREKLKTASPAERDALAKRVSDMLTEARQLPKQVHLYRP
jgi:hypothetical protein